MRRALIILLLAGILGAIGWWLVRWSGAVVPQRDPWQAVPATSAVVLEIPDLRSGWERFTDAVIRAVNEQEKPVVFILWGSYAQKKAAFVDRSRHLVLRSPHPSPLSAHNGFFGTRPFSQANDFLEKHGRTPIDWQLPATVD